MLLTFASPELLQTIAACLFFASGMLLLFRKAALAAKMMLIGIGLMMLPAILTELGTALRMHGYGVLRELMSDAPWWAFVVAPLALLIVGLLVLQAAISLVFTRRVGAHVVGELLAQLIVAMMKLLLWLPVALIRLIGRPFR